MTHTAIDTRDTQRGREIERKKKKEKKKSMKFSFSFFHPQHPLESLVVCWTRTSDGSSNDKQAHSFSIVAFCDTMRICRAWQSRRPAAVEDSNVRQNRDVCHEDLRQMYENLRKNTRT